MDFKNDDDLIDFLENSIFPKIEEENTVLFLGAGASYTKEKNYLGSTILNYYQEKLQVNLETNDLVEFVDRASRLDSFSRQGFDQYVVKLLQLLKPEETHKKIVSMGWRQIVTTNVDLILEKAYSDVIGKSEEYKEILPIRSVSEYQSIISGDQIKYIKLNGCLSDISKYKLIFSTDDFSNNKQFYNLVLSNFSTLTNNVCFLSIGYSFTDGISKRLLTELNKNNLKNDRKIFNIDPFPNEALIPYLEEQNVITIRMTAETFFQHYKKWENDKLSRADKKLPKAYFKKNEIPVQIDTKLKLRLLNKVQQLHKNNFSKNIKADSFYRGEEPDYSVILSDFDISKKNLNDKIIDSVLNSNIQKNLIPINFIIGSHGIGKSTSCLRAIYDLQANHNYVAFDLIDINGVRGQDLEELFKASDSENIILLADDVERHVYFKELMNFRLSLSEHQFNRKISILAPIRENILEKHLKAFSYQNINKIQSEHTLSENEINDLIFKLKEHKIINVRDKSEENKIKQVIRVQFNSDPYVTMLSLIENSTLLRAVSDTLSQISKEAQIAFEYTSLLYQFKILMPASVLKKLINIDWNDFKRNVLQVDAKGLLINTVESPIDIKEDLIFRTKHSIISLKYITNKFKNEDKLLKSYLQIIRALSPSDEHAKLTVDLLKAIFRNKIFQNKDKLEKLYDEAALIFTLNPIFNVQYAMNLEHRRDINSLKKAANRLMQVDSHLRFRNPAITHRRGVIDFNIAKYYHQEENFLLRDEYLNSSEEFYEIKRILDPFSSYSYYDYIKLQMWKIQYTDIDTEDALFQHIKLQDLFIKAFESVVENADYINRLRLKYIHDIKVHQFSKAEILKHLEELYSNYDTRPIVLVFKLNTLESGALNFGENFLPDVNSEDIVEELQDFKHLDLVQKAIFNFHCKRLYNVESRLFLNNIGNEDFEKSNYFKYHYYSYIKECYNLQFSYAKKHLEALKKEYRYLNPSVEEEWIDSETLEVRIFEGIIKSEKLYKIYIPAFGQDFAILKTNFKIYKDKRYSCKIIFTVRGLRIKIIAEVN